LPPRSAFIIARVCSKRGDVELLDQGKMRDAALGLLHVLRDLAAQADDLDHFVLARRRARPGNRPAIVEKVGVEIGVADSIRTGLDARKVDPEIARALAHRG
jgi:hypothetical protein